RKDGYFQFAEGGSLFFDEITNLPLATQAKLLRVLQERQVRPLGGRRTVPVNVRVLAAYNVPLVDEIRAGRFRQDLYYRLNEFVVIVPPLRARPRDIPYLAKRFLTEASMELRRPVVDIHDEALDVLVQYPWPGNVRELRNVIRRAVLLASGLIRSEHLRGLVSDSLHTPPAPPALMPRMGRSLKAIAETAVAEAESLAIRARRVGCHHVDHRARLHFTGAGADHLQWPGVRGVRQHPAHGSDLHLGHRPVIAERWRSRRRASRYPRPRPGDAEQRADGRGTGRLDERSERNGRQLRVAGERGRPARKRGAGHGFVRSGRVPGDVYRCQRLQ